MLTLLLWLLRSASRLTALVLMAVVAVAGYARWQGEFDPIQLAGQAVAADPKAGRSEALQILDFAAEQNLADPGVLAAARERYEYTSQEKAWAVAQGAVTGNVVDAWSAIGAIGSDLLVIGDLRDLAVQSWRYQQGLSVDPLITALSGIGVATTAAELTGVGVTVDAGTSVAKNGWRFARGTGKVVPDSVLRRMFDELGTLATNPAAIRNSRSAVELADSGWRLFRGVGLDMPTFVKISGNLKSVDDLKAAARLTETYGNSGKTLLLLEGGDALRLTRNLGEAKAMTLFKRQPAVARGLLRVSQRASQIAPLVRLVKVIKKYGMAGLLTALAALVAALAGLPWWSLLALLAACLLLLVPGLIFNLLTFGKFKRQPNRNKGQNQDQSKGRRGKKKVLMVDRWRP
ncbi:hypothetical protein [Leptolyngbya sp. FACHB-261]|uniref:hypothetical protein n=1 Tax=Leptolyngbya sp. FACHB-261 TaxID=2692806 RepID=UPI001689B657|nr:hypothetical protein [Leptolyngbya sp. FACHB-261]MBD2104822.1 hypothetical protein [Leptolyngbya sp. FACHB-261]